LAKANRRLEAAIAQAELFKDERDQARRELATAQARIAELENLPPADCSDETDRALAAERRVADAIAVLTR
jgi:hypothetical protein